MAALSAPGGAEGGQDLDSDSDAVVRRRRQVARLADTGQRVGYLLYAVAVAAFVVGAIAGFSAASVTVVVAALAVGSAVLAPAIVAGYAVKAAEREDRARSQRPPEGGETRTKGP